MEWILIGLGVLLLWCFWRQRNRGPRKRKALTLEQAKQRHLLDPSDVDAENLGIPEDLLRDLGALVYFSATMQAVKDRKQATFPWLWSAVYTQRGRGQAAGVMGVLGERLCRRIGELPESTEPDRNKKILTAEVVGQVGLQGGIDLRREILEALGGVKGG